MSIYRVDGEQLVPVERTTFKDQGLEERRDIQPLLKSRIDAVAPGTLIVSEEFGDWQDSQRRIDLLGIDKDANLVVIELKRTEDGGHMELQAIRYAAMISTLTFDQLVPVHDRYLRKNGIDKNARVSLLEFLDWEDSGAEPFGQEVRIVLAAAEFSKEVTTTVMWLRDVGGLDIRCVRMEPYASEGNTLLDIQTVIPAPEAADYQVRIQEKQQRERESRRSARNLSKHDVWIADEEHPRLNKRRMMLALVSGILRNGGAGAPQKILTVVQARKLQKFDGVLDSEQVKDRFQRNTDGASRLRFRGYFCNEDELIHVGNLTYVLSKKWGRPTLATASKLAALFPELQIRYELTE